METTEWLRVAYVVFKEYGLQSEVVAGTEVVSVRPVRQADVAR